MATKDNGGENDEYVTRMNNSCHIRRSNTHTRQRMIVESIKL